MASYSTSSSLEIKRPILSCHVDTLPLIGNGRAREWRWNCEQLSQWPWRWWRRREFCYRVGVTNGSGRRANNCLSIVFGRREAPYEIFFLFISLSLENFSLFLSLSRLSHVCSTYCLFAYLHNALSVCVKSQHGSINHLSNNWLFLCFLSLTVCLSVSSCVCQKEWLTLTRDRTEQ